MTIVDVQEERAALEAIRVGCVQRRCAELTGERACRRHVGSNVATNVRSNAGSPIPTLPGDLDAPRLRFAR